LKIWESEEHNEMPAEREIKDINSTDADGLSFLVKAARAETTLFDNFMFEAQLKVAA
jgi:hypothetical protein